MSDENDHPLQSEVEERLLVRFICWVGAGGFGFAAVAAAYSALFRDRKAMAPTGGKLSGAEPWQHAFCAVFWFFLACWCLWILWSGPQQGPTGGAQK